jgi:hypothetical protein
VALHLDERVELGSDAGLDIGVESGHLALRRLSTWWQSNSAEQTQQGAQGVHQVMFDVH